MDPEYFWPGIGKHLKLHLWCADHVCAYNSKYIVQTIHEHDIIAYKDARVKQERSTKYDT